MNFSYRTIYLHLNLLFLIFEVYYCYPVDEFGNFFHILFVFFNKIIFQYYSNQIFVEFYSMLIILKKSVIFY